MRGSKLLHGVGADAPLQRAVDIRLEACRPEARTIVEREVQAEQCPGRVLKTIELAAEVLRELAAPDHALEGLVHIDGARHELIRTHAAPVGKLDAGCAATLDQNALDMRLRRKAAAGRDKGLHQAARQIERAALAELIAGLQV